MFVHKGGTFLSKIFQPNSYLNFSVSFYRYLREERSSLKCFEHKTYSYFKSLFLCYRYLREERSSLKKIDKSYFKCYSFVS